MLEKSQTSPGVEQGEGQVYTQAKEGKPAHVSTGGNKCSLGTSPGVFSAFPIACQGVLMCETTGRGNSVSTGLESKHQLPGIGACGIQIPLDRVWVGGVFSVIPQ